jgi:hypothetical protein
MKEINLKGHKPNKRNNGTANRKNEPWKTAEGERQEQSNKSVGETGVSSVPPPSRKMKNQKT